MSADQEPSKDYLSPRRYSGKRVVFWMFLCILIFGALFWLGMVLFVMPIRV